MATKDDVELGRFQSDPGQPTVIFPLVTATKVNLAEIDKLSDLFTRIQQDGPVAHCCKHTWER